MWDYSPQEVEAGGADSHLMQRLYALDCTTLLDGLSSISVLCLWVYIAWVVGLELAVNLRMT